MTRLTALTAVFLLTGCPAALTTQQTLSRRVHAAASQCLRLPVGDAKTALCTRAQLCQTQALAAAKALQLVNAARSRGDTDVAAEAASAGLVVLAETACRGWR